MPSVPAPVTQQELFLPVEPNSYRDGRDELNLAEFPIATVGSRNDPSVKTLRFEDQAFDKESGETIHRQLTITASDQYGLPTASDDEVLLGLLQISHRHDFESETVSFTPYQLMRILGWSISTANYRRVREAIERWLGVTLHYKNAWRDRQTRQWVDAGFHFIEFVKFYKPGEGEGVLAPEGLSVIRWNPLVFRNLREGNLKRLDFHFYRHLESNISKRMYRFLDKRFYLGRRLHFTLERFACEKIGLSRPVKVGTGGRVTLDVAQLKRRLQPAILELEQKGFLVGLPPSARFTKDAAGEWQVAFERMASKPVAAGEDQPSLELDVSEISPLEGRLTGHGVSGAQARRLVGEFDLERIKVQLEALEYLLTKGEKFAPQNRAGWLVQAVTENYGPPRGFKTNIQREKEKQEKARRAQERELAKRQGCGACKQVAETLDVAHQTETSRVHEYLEGLSEIQRQEVEAAALQASGLRQGRFSAKVRAGLLHTYVTNLLSKDQKAAG